MNELFNVLLYQIKLQGVEKLLEVVPNRDPRRGSNYAVFSPENKFMNRMSKKGSLTHLENQSSMSFVDNMY